MSGTIMRRIVVRGRVQQVGYRAWILHTAVRHGRDGWVRNRADGSVEALLVGSETAVQIMIEACWRGPPAASVDALDVHEAEPSELAMRAGDGVFAVLPTA
jgi:acylphosphatase